MGPSGGATEAEAIGGSDGRTGLGWRQTVRQRGDGLWEAGSGRAECAEQRRGQPGPPLACGAAGEAVRRGAGERGLGSMRSRETEGQGGCDGCPLPPSLQDQVPAAQGRLLEDVQGEAQAQRPVGPCQAPAQRDPRPSTGLRALPFLPDDLASKANILIDPLELQAATMDDLDEDQEPSPAAAQVPRWGRRGPSLRAGVSQGPPSPAAGAPAVGGVTHLPSPPQPRGSRSRERLGPGS